MKIINFHAENIKKLRVVDITPTSAVVQVTGRNGQGKTSVLDAIMYALGGKSDIPAEPLRRGAAHGSVRLDLGDLIVTRRFLESGATALQVETNDAKTFRSPQNVLDELMGKMTFDPLAFTRLDAKAQLALLRTIVTVDVDLDALDKANAADFATRTELNRDAKALRAQAAGINVPEQLPDEPLDAALLLQAIEQVGEFNAELERRKARRNEVALGVSQSRRNAQAKLDEANRLRARAAELEAEGQALNLAADADQERLDAAEALPEPKDATEARIAYNAALATNEGIKARERWRALAAEAAKLEARADALTDAMQKRTEQRTAAIAAAKMPVPGLGFGDGMVTLNDLPFDQASGAEQLRASVAIAMAMNPTLRILRIKDGSLLDDDSLAMLTAVATEHDFQVWIEMVDASGKVGIVMEDGAVVAVDGQPVQPEGEEPPPVPAPKPSRTGRAGKAAP